MAESIRDPRGSMTHEAALSSASEIADRVLAPSAAQNDKAGRFSTEAVAALGGAGLLGLMLPGQKGGAGLGPRTFAAVTATLAEADASVAMVYVMHVLGAASISAARQSAADAMRPILERSEERRVGKECRSRWSPYH